MDRAARIAERTRDLLDEIVRPELHPINADPYPATVGEVADEVARFVLELDASGAARGLASEVVGRLSVDATVAARKAARLCRQGAHRDKDIRATARVRYKYQDDRPNMWSWTTNVCERHAQLIKMRFIREGRRDVEIVPAEWTPQDDCTHGADCAIHPGTGQVHNLDQELPGMWESSDLYGGEADGFERTPAVTPDRCNPATGYHSTPHRGCIMR